MGQPSSAVQDLDVGDGPRAFLVEDHRYPIVWMRIAVRMGADVKWRVKNQLDHRWGVAINMALNSPDSTASFSPWHDALGYGVDVELLRKDFRQVATDLDRVMAPRYRYNALNFPKFQRQARRERRRSPSWRLEREIARAFFVPSDPRRKRALLRGARRTNTSKLASLVVAAWAMPGVQVGFAGDIDASVAKTMVARMRRLGTGLPTTARVKQPALREPTKDVVINLRDHEEVLIAWGRPGLSWSDPDAAAALLALEVVERRLVAELREGRGDTYRVDTWGLLGLRPRPFTVTTSTSPSRAAAHEAAVVALFRQVHEDGLAHEEIEQARNRLRNQAAVHTGAPYEVLHDAMMRSWLPDGVSLLRPSLDVPSEEVDRVARSLFNPDAFTRFVVQPTGQPALHR